ncbi:MAG TPA: hypothetical protein PLE10_07435 [Brevefilum sp.]|nr:hypothetical protein [Brevefilum sp.]HPL70051.1 hypothetical protein [Brevefilum sp.]
MRADTIFENVRVILRQIRDYPVILDSLSPEQRLELDRLVMKLGRDVQSAADNAALAQAADSFLTTIENTPAIINLFIPGASQEHIQELQGKRKLPLDQPIGDEEFTCWKELIENCVREYPYRDDENDETDR